MAEQVHGPDELTGEQVQQLVALAAVLLPGDDEAPAASAVPGLDLLVRRAVTALGREAIGLSAMVATLPEALDWGSVKGYSEADPESFELLATVASAAYFMAPESLQAIGYPSADRKAPRNDLIVEELETGVLDDVMAREPFYRKIPS